MLDVRGLLLPAGSHADHRHRRATTLIDTDDWGGEVMMRLDDGWCGALDRDTMMCTIYELAVDLPGARDGGAGMP